MAATKFPSKTEFAKVVKELQAGDVLTITKVARVFGPAFYELLLFSLMDAGQAGDVIKEAVRAAQEEEIVATNR